MIKLLSKLRLLVEALEFFAREMPVESEEKYNESREIIRELYDYIYRPKHTHTVPVAQDDETVRLSEDLWQSRKPSKAYEAAASLARHLKKRHGLDHRLLFIDESFDIYLDGHLYEHLDPTGYWVIKTLASHPNEYLNNGVLIELINDAVSLLKPGKKESTFIPRGAAGKKRIDRGITYLPQELQSIIKGKPGSGRILQMP